MKALVIGAAGFVGNYLIDALAENGYDVYATKLKHETVMSECKAVYDLDITAPADVKQLLDELRPDKIFHLAAQSSVKLSWDNPELTVKVNVPAIWDTVTVGGESLEMHRNADGTAFVYVNIVPDTGAVEIIGG